MARQADTAREDAYNVLHAAGWSDRRIALAFGTYQFAVSKWRNRAGLPPNCKQFRKAGVDYEVVRQLYNENWNDAEIAQEIGVDPSVICRWRASVGLSPNWEQRALGDETLRAARKMLRLGASKDQVADQCSISRRTVQRIREGMPQEGLRGSGKNSIGIAAQVKKDPAIIRRIEKAIGTLLPSDVRNDAVFDLYTDVLGGKVAPEFIEKVAPSYRNRAFGMCGSKFGPRSLDEENDEGWSLMETLEDADAYDDMERAAEAAFGQR